MYLCKQYTRMYVNDYNIIIIHNDYIITTRMCLQVYTYLYYFLHVALCNTMEGITIIVRNV